MFDLRLKTSVNFDFKKLKNEIPKIAKKKQLGVKPSRPHGTFI